MILRTIHDLGGSATPSQLASATGSANIPKALWKMRPMLRKYGLGIAYYRSPGKASYHLMIGVEE